MIIFFYYIRGVCMKSFIVLLSVLVSANTFAGCLENFKYVVDHNKANLELTEQVLVRGNAIQQQYILLKANLYNLTVQRKIDNQTKAHIAHQERMIRVLGGQETQEDIAHLLNKINKSQKMDLDGLQRRIDSALLTPEKFCLSNVGDLSDETENYEKLKRNTTEITLGNVADKEHMEKAIAPRTEEEIIRLLMKY